MAIHASRKAAERHAELCEQALVELLRFVASELDPDPGAWDEYFTKLDHRRLALALQQREHDRKFGLVE